MAEKILFTSESVSEGHPDKVADAISDAIVDNYLAQDPEAKVAAETLVTTGQVIIAGEVKSTAKVNVSEVVRETIKNIGYTNPDTKFDYRSVGIINLLHEQSADISRGVERKDISNQGAGDQGMMFGYATNETETYMPLTHFLATRIVQVLAEIRKKGEYMTYLRPDAKSQVTIEFDKNGKPKAIDTIVVSTQHDDFIKATEILGQEEADQQMHDIIENDVRSLVMQVVKDSIADDNIVKLFDKGYNLLVNPTGKFVIGGPDGDTGLTGRKIIVDTYGGYGAHGGGAFSGKDASKVDRSAAYMARYIAKNMVAAGVADKMLIQISYAIGVAQPVSVNVNTYGTSKVGSDALIAHIATKLFDLRPAAIIERLKLKNPIYSETSAYGHFGREPMTVRKLFNSPNGAFHKDVDRFTWEELDAVEDIKKAFNL